ncbi:MAG: hypothetical protein R6X20_16535 [Phycisphaerae bacterium]
MTSPLPPDPPNWTTRRVGKDEELQCDRCMQRVRPGRTAYVADHSGDEFPHTAVYCSPRCRHFAERPNTTYLRDDGAALAAALDVASKRPLVFPTRPDRTTQTGRVLSP